MSNDKCSQDLFEDSLPLEDSQTETSSLSEQDIAWRGVELDSLRKLQYNLIPSVAPSSFHTVAFRLPVQAGKCPSPYPKNYQDKWEENYVRLPCSKSNFVNISEDRKVPAWGMIKERLSANISYSTDLQQAILSYAWRKSYQRWNFVALHRFCSETLSKPEEEYFFETILPGIVDLALSLDSEVTCELPLLRRHKSYNLSITQRQAACIIANAFLCTFPERNFAKESLPYPSINFTRVFLDNGKIAQEKLKCFINYFRRCFNSNLDGVISFSRRSINPSNLPSWLDSDKKFPLLHVTSEGTIDGNGQGLMQVDFANKLVGGGVLGYGCVQEEILFLICPELIVSRLFTECLDETECLIVTGAELFNRHTGYADSFRWAGNYEDTTPLDSYKRKCRTIIVMNALHFQKNSPLQYKPESIFREINKAYCGFSFGCDGKDKLSIATGNWGCGAFNGDPKLKALIQLIAAAQSNRHLAYFTFYDNQLRDNIFSIYSFLSQNSITVGQLCCSLNKYSAYCEKNGKIPLYDYLYSCLLNIDSESFEGIIDGESSKGQSEINNITEAESKESVDSKDQSTDDLVLEPHPNSEPIPAETYSFETEEGRKRCLESEMERWQAYKSAKTYTSRLTPLKENLKRFLINSSSFFKNTEGLFNVDNYMSNMLRRVLIVPVSY